METSIFIAKILGSMYLLIAIAALFNPKSFMKQIKGLMESGSMFTFGIFVFIGCLMIVLSHSIWEPKWYLMVTIVGWIGMIKGALFILAPDSMLGFSKKVIDKINYSAMAGVTGLFFGLYFCYFGFMVKF